MSNSSAKLVTIGILGGTFDPPHWGHLRLAEHFSKVLELDQIVWLPAGLPWQKGENITSAAQRLAMSQAAVETLQDIFDAHHIYTEIDVSTLEMNREGPSYTIDTVKELRELYGPDTSIIWLMGQDSWSNLTTWHGWEELPQYVHLAVESRPQENPSQPQAIFSHEQTDDIGLLQSKASGHVLIDQSLQINLASSTLREKIAQGGFSEEVADAIPPLVLDYIEKHGLYKA